MAEPCVLICVDDPVVSSLCAVNLAPRGFRVYQRAWSPSLGVHPRLPEPIDLVIADLNGFDPAATDGQGGVARLRQIFPSQPLVVLAYAQPSTHQLEKWMPCACLRKPFAVDDLLMLVQKLLPPCV